jgi:hypothetical protein
MPDSQIDFSDAPEALPLSAKAEIGRFYRWTPMCSPGSARGKKYQTYMNEVLRREMQTHHPGR